MLVTNYDPLSWLGQATFTSISLIDNWNLGPLLVGAAFCGLHQETYVY